MKKNFQIFFMGIFLIFPSIAYSEVCVSEKEKRVYAEIFEKNNLYALKLDFYKAKRYHQLANCKGFYKKRTEKCLLSATVRLNAAEKNFKKEIHALGLNKNVDLSEVHDWYIKYVLK